MANMIRCPASRRLYMRGVHDNSLLLKILHLSGCKSNYLYAIKTGMVLNLGVKEVHYRGKEEIFSAHIHIAQE